jgi:aminodeoxyfutalosine deaminase
MHSLDPAIASLPKIHVHCHLEGALRAETFVELTRRYGLSTRFRPGGNEIAGPTDPAEVYRFADFGEFLLLFAAVSRALARPDDYAQLAREFAADARAQNVVHGEIFVSPSVWSYFHSELDVRATLRTMIEELRGANMHLILDVTRNFGAESAMKTAELAASLAGDGVIGIGLGGDEARFPAPLFKEVFAYARSCGLHTVAHAGEADGAQSVRDAVEILKAERIGHGVRALEDESVVELLRERNIPLEICPTSNFLTGAASRNEPHPYEELDRAGVLVTIDADDPTLFGTTISQEYALVAKQSGLDTLKRYINNAANASFMRTHVRA